MIDMTHPLPFSSPSSGVHPGGSIPITRPFRSPIAGPEGSPTRSEPWQTNVQRPFAPGASPYGRPTRSPVAGPPVSATKPAPWQTNVQRPFAPGANPYGGPHVSGNEAGAMADERAASVRSRSESVRRPACSGDEAGTVADERAASVCAGVVCGSACLGKRVDAIVQPADLMASFSATGRSRYAVRSSHENSTSAVRSARIGSSGPPIRNALAYCSWAVGSRSRSAAGRRLFRRDDHPVGGVGACAGCREKSAERSRLLRGAAAARRARRWGCPTASFVRFVVFAADRTLDSLPQ